MLICLYFRCGRSERVKIGCIKTQQNASMLVPQRVTRIWRERAGENFNQGK